MLDLHMVSIFVRSFHSIQTYGKYVALLVVDCNFLGMQSVFLSSRNTHTHTFSWDLSVCVCWTNIWFTSNWHGWVNQKMICYFLQMHPLPHPHPYSYPHPHPHPQRSHSWQLKQ